MIRVSAFGCCSLSAIVALLAGCGWSQPPISAQGAMSIATSQTEKVATRSGRRGTGVTEFVYVADRSSNHVSAYAIDSSSGALTQIEGSPFAASAGPQGIAIDPSGKFAYVANDGSPSGNGNISAFVINPRTGALAPVQGSPFAAGSNPIAVAVNPSGTYVYVANYTSADVSILGINPRTGALKQIKSSPHKTRPSPLAEAIDPTGKFIYVTNQNYNRFSLPGHITGYAIDARSGALTEIRGSHKYTSDSPDSVAIDPSGKFVYVPSYNQNRVSAYAITASSGALSSVAGQPFYGSDYPGGVAIDPNGSFAYVVADNEVDAYTIASDGALTPVSGSPFAGGYLPDGAAVDPLGKFLYVANVYADNDISAYAINPGTGALTPVQGSPFASGQNPAGIATCEIEGHRCIPPPL